MAGAEISYRLTREEVVNCPVTVDEEMNCPAVVVVEMSCLVVGEEMNCRAVVAEEMNCPTMVGNQKPYGRMTSSPTEGKVKEREKPGPLPHVRILQLAKPATVNKLNKHISLCMF